MAENAHRCFHLQVVSRTPEVWAKGNSRCHHTFTELDGPASWTSFAQECLRHRSTYRLPSCRRLSRTWCTALLGSVHANTSRVSTAATELAEGQQPRNLRG